ncbi:hypothetical protein [Streptomyces sp. NPDC046685]|uniref:hypothetical protein n=1 Tax=Streptomyces sp. NPDC046685 TaxID=3157202 RepID=UPI0033E7331E
MTCAPSPASRRLSNQLTPYSDGQATASRGKSSTDNGEIAYDASTSLDGCRLPAT